jgi:hypothetical protein
LYFPIVAAVVSHQLTILLLGRIGLHFRQVLQETAPDGLTLRLPAKNE